MNMMRRATTLLLTILMAALLANPASAQLFGDPKTKADILLDSEAAAPGTTIRGVIRLTMTDHWHTYWKYPGDVGLPTEAEWEVPEGWKVSEFQWPAPSYIETAGLVSYAYDEEVLFPFEITVPEQVKAGQEVELKVHLSWLECEQACVPGEDDIVVPVSVADEVRKSSQQELVKQAFESLPEKESSISAKLLPNREIALAVPPEMSDEVRFFPDSKGQITESAPQLFADGVLTVQPAPEINNRLSGVVSDGKSSFEIDIELNLEPAVVPAAGIGTILFVALGAFVGGLVLNLMPCVFPVLSLKVLGIVEQSNSEGRPAWHHGVVFGAGVVLSFWVMSGLLLVVRAAGEEVGWGYHLQNPVMIGGLAILFLLIGLNLFGVFEVGENLTQLSGVAEKKEGFAHSFWSGVLTTLAATPCTAPFMGSAVGFALAQPVWVAFLIFTTLALGVAAPYMMLTLFPKLLDKLPRPGAWMVTFKQILAFPMLLAVVWLTWVFGGQMGTDRMALFLLALVGIGFASWVYGKWGTSFEPKEKRWGSLLAGLALVGSLYTGYSASQPQQGAELWVDYSPELVAQLKEEGKPFFLDFTADWCTSCKANELVALSGSEVLGKFKDLEVTLVKADWTKKDPVITKALAEYGRAGVPLYVLYPGQDAKPQILPEVLLPSTVLEALETVKK